MIRKTRTYANANTLTIGTHSAGDMMCMFAVNNAGSAITVPSGWTTLIDTTLGGDTIVLAYRVATSSSETAGTWTNADWLIIGVYEPGAGGTLGIGGYDSKYNSNSDTIQFPGLTMTNTDNTSWVLGFWHADANNWVPDGIEPADFTNRLDFQTTDSGGLMDTLGAVSSFGAQNSGAMPGASNARAVAVEITETTAGGRSITDIDTDNNVQAGQTSVTVTTVGLDAAPTTQTATLGGESLTVVSAGATSWTVSVPLTIALKWGTTTNQLALTDDTGTVTLDNVTLSAATGWAYQDYNTAPGAGTESFKELAESDFTITAELTADQLQYTTDAALTVNADTTVVVSPAQDVSGTYAWFDNSTGTRHTTTYLIDDLGTFTPPASAGDIQGEQQQAARTATSSEGTYNEDLIAWARQTAAISSGTFNECLIQALQTALSSSSTNLNDLMAEAALDRSKTKWQEIGSDLTNIGT